MNQIITFAQENNVKCLEKEPMSRHTTMKLGGDADIALFPTSSKQVAQLVKLCGEERVPLTVLGKGSNLLVSDKGIRGVVMVLGSGFARLRDCGDGVIAAQAGASLTRLCKMALRHSLTGLEFAYGIPGSVGGAAFMNAGAYGGEMKDVLLKCRHVTPAGELEEMEATAMELGYRHSAYASNGCIITDVFVQLEQGEPDTIEAKMEELMDRRCTKQPLEYPSAGSTFKRPEGYFAGTLIEECALKGKQVGGAQVSEKHAGFLINVGGATCQDFLDLASLVQETVLAQKGVELEMEIRVLGE